MRDSGTHHRNDNITMDFYSIGLAYDKPDIKAVMDPQRSAAPISDTTDRNQETDSKEADIKSNRVSASPEGHKNKEKRNGTSGCDDRKREALETSCRVGPSRQQVKAAINPL